MALLIAETTFKNISKLYLVLMIYCNHICNDLLQSYMGRNSMLNAAFKS